MEPFGAWMGRSFVRKSGFRAKLYGAYVTLFGVPALHSHIRLRAVQKHFVACARALELGAGPGGMGVAFVRRTGSPVILAPYTRKEAALLLGAVCPLEERDRIEVVVADAMKPFVKDRSIDTILLIDVLEHVRDDAAALRSIHGSLTEGGTLLLSVPTPMYPRYFGEAFDARIGHLRHYVPTSIIPLLEESGFEVTAWEYYTRPFAARLCRIWYQGLLKETAPALLARLLFTPLASLLTTRDAAEPNHSETRSASILVVARRRSDGLKEDSFRVQAG